MKNIIFVHGASSTPISFNYIRQNLPIHRGLEFSYDTNVDIQETIEKLFAFVPENEEVNIIGHSLGGILAVAVNYINESAGNHKKIRKCIALSSPLSGSKIASFIKWMYPKYGLFDNISVSNPLILTIQSRGAIVPTLNVITSGGEVPLIKEKNDGVVSVASQMSLKNCDLKFLDLNHFEVLLSPKTVEIIREYLW
jgi:pimeloyl-ACP methyl ester carboxylesterase